MIVDLFCGGGGASEGIRAALGRDVDIALNHSAAAIEMHAANHPKTRHIQGDVWAIPSWLLVPGRKHPQIDLLWASPDCRHYSRARGGKPVESRIRDLPWVIVRWARDVRPKLIGMENVAEIEGWGPLDGEGKPIPEKVGETWRAFVGQLRLLGYSVEWRTLTACDYGAPTSRRRLILMARADGAPIRWPEPTHGPGRPQPFRTAAECIDWSDTGNSIFLTAEEGRAVGVRRPLAEATQRRIAEGIRRYVLEAPTPYIVRIGHQSGDGGKVHPITRPLSTVTSKNEHLLCVPTVTKVNSHGWDRDGGPSMSPDNPLWTTLTKNNLALVVPAMVQVGWGEREGQAPRCLDIQKPLGVVVAGGVKHGAVGVFLSKHYGGVVGHSADRPLGTITTTDHHSIGAAFLCSYYGSGVGQDVEDPMRTVTTKDRFAVVTAWLQRHGIDRPPLVTVEGQTYGIVDVSMRMLRSAELAKAQGFPADYILTGTEKDRVARIGNSVPPQLVEATIRANSSGIFTRSKPAANAAK